MRNAVYGYILKRAIKALRPKSTISDVRTALSYQQLFERAEGLARTLTHHKYGILCESQLNAAIALLACFAANKTAVPMSSRYGEAHARGIIAAARLSYAITDSGIAQIADTRPEAEDLSDIPLIMHTSGTTGSPKGAMISNGNLIANLEDIAAYFDIGSSDRILVARPLYHCAVLTGEYLAALAAGAAIHFYDGEFQPAGMIQTMRNHGISALGGTPTLFYHLCRTAERHGQPLPLRVAVASGECMDAAVAKLMRRSMPETRIYNVYGLTEASPRVSWLDPARFDERPTSVGVPLRSVEVKTEGGELLVRGPNVMRGYYGNHEETERALRDGWLHTGDMAELANDGCISILGRRDDMIIRAGVNIYPSEIESVLRYCEGINDVMAYGIKRSRKVGQGIGLKIVSGMSKNEVFELCKAKLPRYQLPDSIEIVDVIPRNASGKAIRKEDGNDAKRA